MLIIYKQCLIYISTELQSFDDPRKDRQGIQSIDLTHLHRGKVTITLNRG